MEPGLDSWKLGAPRDAIPALSATLVKVPRNQPTFPGSIPISVGVSSLHSSFPCFSECAAIWITIVVRVRLICLRFGLLPNLHSAWLAKWSALSQKLHLYSQGVYGSFTKTSKTNHYFGKLKKFRIFSRAQ